MHRHACLTVMALMAAFTLSDASLAPGQPPLQPLHLSIVDQNGFEVSMSFSSTVLRFHVTGTPGMWVYVHSTLALTPDGPLAGELGALYPWLVAPESLPASPTLESVAPVSHPTIDVPLVEVEAHYGLCVSSSERIRSQSQPILLNSPTLAWDAYDAGWLVHPDPENGYQRCRHWHDRLAFPPTGTSGNWMQTQDFGAERVLDQRIFDQAPNKDIAELFVYEHLGAALSSGLELRFQAIGMIDPAGSAASTHSATPALPSAPVVRPHVVLSGTRIIRVTLGHPQTAGGPGVSVAWDSLAPTATAGSLLLVPMKGIVPPLQLVLSAGSRNLALTGTLHSPGWAKFQLPPLLPAGLVLTPTFLQNAIGSTTNVSAWGSITILAP